MLAYGSGLRIGEIVNLRVEDVDNKTMRGFVREEKEKLEKYKQMIEKVMESLK